MWAQWQTVWITQNTAVLESVDMTTWRREKKPFQVLTENTSIYSDISTVGLCSQSSCDLYPWVLQCFTGTMSRNIISQLPSFPPEWSPCETVSLHTPGGSLMKKKKEHLTTIIFSTLAMPFPKMVPSWSPTPANKNPNRGIPSSA